MTQNNNNSIVESFSRKFGTLLGSGIQLLKCLETIASEENNIEFKEVVENIIKFLKKGENFSVILKKHPQFFSDSYITMVQDGENKGMLDIIMVKVADKVKDGTITV